MATAKQVLKIAASQIGYAEERGNRTKYGKWYRMDGSAWCDMFVSWVFWKAQATSIGGKFAYTPSHADWFRKKNRFVTGTRGIRAGDVAFFRFSGSRIHHVGFVESVRANGDVVTIEGNTSVGNDRTGGRVMRRVRSPKYIVGYGRPKYDVEPKVVARALAGAVIRKTKTPNGKRLAVVPVGAELTVHSKTAVWSYVEYGGVSGFILTAKIRVDAENA